MCSENGRKVWTQDMARSERHHVGGTRHTHRQLEFLAQCGSGHAGKCFLQEAIASSGLTLVFWDRVSGITEEQSLGGAPILKCRGYIVLSFKPAVGVPVGKGG